MDAVTNGTGPCIAPELAMSVNSRSWTEVELRRSAEVEPLLEQVVAAMVAQGYSRRTCWEMRLALEEAIVNGLRHGNRFDPTKRVLARFHVGPSAVLAEVEDEGPGFDPADVPDPTDPEHLERPCGRGLLLMHHYLTWLCYRGSGNHVTLCKQRLAPV
jgi:serine/threonine-protein kinase RsbW